MLQFHLFSFISFLTHLTQYSISTRKKATKISKASVSVAPVQITNFLRALPGEPNVANETVCEIAKVSICVTSFKWTYLST